MFTEISTGGYLKINSTWVGIEPMSYSHNWFLTSLKSL